MRENALNRDPTETTELLNAWSQGDEEAGEQLLEVVYAELLQLASRSLSSEREDHTLEPSALVHEAFLRLIGQAQCSWKSRGHFSAVAAKMMRRILIDHARSRRRAKRGGGVRPISLATIGELAREEPQRLLDLDRALAELAQLDPDKASMLELHYFGGLSIEETAKAAGCSVSTVTRHLRMAKAWLSQALGRGEES